MYKRNAQGWFKHLDFILWDVFVLQISFVLGFMIRHGWGDWPYNTWRQGYNSMAILLVVVDIMVAVIFNTMHNVMKRGRLKEFAETIIYLLYPGREYVFPYHIILNFRLSFGLSGSFDILSVKVA